MTGPCLFGILLIVSAAMLLFVLGFLFFQIGLSGLATMVFSTAENIMLFGLAMLFSLGFILVIRALYRDLRAFFSKEAIALRKAWAVQAQIMHFSQEGELKFRQLQYFSKVKRQRLLADNNKKHIQELYCSIEQELQAVKNQIPADKYQILRKDLRRHHKQGNANAMLALRKNII